ncbi:MAG: protein kinase [Polyangiaceae bacterium]
MRDPYFYVSGLLSLPDTQDAAERRSAWRQSLTAISRAAQEEGPSPLDGLDPNALARGVQVALQAGLADDLDWLSPAASGVALYVLANALPPGQEQRELGRRMLARLLAGNAETFTALATKMAQSHAKGISTSGARARIALVAEAPINTDVSDGPLALVLVSRRDLAREWIERPSTGSLPARRLAARLIERAAREAVRRADGGDEHALRVFKSELVEAAWARLLKDRESLVWRHVAAARGLIQRYLPGGTDALVSELQPELGPTEWRRAATALAAHAAIDPDFTLKHLDLVFARAEKDPGLVQALLWGTSRAAESEPEVALAMGKRAIDRSAQLTSEAVLEVRRDFGVNTLTDALCMHCLGRLREAAGPTGARPDENAEVIAREIALDLDISNPMDPRPLRAELDTALMVFVEQGAPAAYAEAKRILERSQQTVRGLSTGRSGIDADRRPHIGVLRDLDLALLERNVFADLLHLGTSSVETRATDEAIDGLREQLASFIIAEEKVGQSNVTLSLRRLRALLHLADGDTGDAEDTARTQRQRGRWIRIARALLERATGTVPQATRRALLATAARALDALVRLEAIAGTDVFLLLAAGLRDSADFETLAEASMDSEVAHMLSTYGKFLRISAAQAAAKPDSLLPPAQGGAAQQEGWLGALAKFADDIVYDASARAETLRTVLVRLETALRQLLKATSLRSLSTGGADQDVLGKLESALSALGQVTQAARARLEPSVMEHGPHSGMMATPLSLTVARVLSGADPTLRDDTLQATADELVKRIPLGLRGLVSGAILRLLDLPVEATKAEGPAQAPVQLPPWLPARRTLGGFYVLRSLGAGAAGSVFLVNRLEDRHEPNAERFALKVPDFSETAARSLSEAEFFQLFREEATALIGLPSHKNLAKFVTFDLSARPKPILVMEFVEGTTLERILTTRSIDMQRCISLLDDLLKGLEAMHKVGIGHFDVKPANVILRGGEEAVLVDFGLSGRNIRPGCATGPYGAPEVWGSLDDDMPSVPLAADVYAFGCLAYEAFTTKTLFDAPNEVALIAMHVMHDGDPAGVAELAKNPKLQAVAEFLKPTLRRNPAERATVPMLRENLKALAAKLAANSTAWPIEAAS